MLSLPSFSLPLSHEGPPAGYEWDIDGRSISRTSATSAFDTGIDLRDSFLGKPRCIVCGIGAMPRRCHIIPASEQKTWKDLRDRRWIPETAKEFGKHEPRNGLLMCSNHQDLFDTYCFFVRYMPETRKFIFVNFSGDPESSLAPYHGKAIGLDIQDKHAPFPSLFIIHEMRARGFNPFEPTNPDIPNDQPWQDWIANDGILHSGSSAHLFNRSRPPNARAVPSMSTQPQRTVVSTSSTGGLPSESMSLALNQDTLNNILKATRESASWKACVMENETWEGTAEENRLKYLALMSE